MPSIDPALQSGGVTVFHGNCMDVLGADENGYPFELGYGTRHLIPDCSVDAVVTDPPYGLANTDPAHVAETITRWVNGERDYLPGGAGFMGKAWDAFVPPVAVWDDCLRVLKPGGHVLAFAGSRTVDLMTLAMRLAGFEIRDSIAWLYGSGFPKSLDVSKAIDKAGGDPLAFREFARAYATAVAASPLNHADIDRHLGIKSSSCYWAREDHRGGMPPRHHWEAARDLLELPESFERLYDAAEREVIGERTGGIHSAFDYVRTGESGKSATFDITAPATPAASQWQGWGTALKPAFEPVVVGRKPLAGTVAANILAYGTGALNIDGCRVATTDKLGGGAEKVTTAAQKGDEGWTRPWMSDPGAQEGHAARVRDNVVKAEALGRWPANVVLDESQAAALDEQSGTLTSGKMHPTHTTAGVDGRASAYGKDAAGGFTTMETYGDTGGASRFFYVAKADASERPRVDGTAHPTVKPLALMRWLVRLVTPPGGTVLEPFAGSGTTVEACIVEGFQCIAIEREPDYLPLIEARISRRRDPVRAIELAAEDLGLFGLDTPA